MQHALHIDFETASATDLRTAGVYRYAECPTTRVWGFKYSWGDGLYYEWRPEVLETPDRLLDHIARKGVVVAHNAGFERRIWQFTRERYGRTQWPKLEISQQVCTMARAAASGLPQDLDRLAEVLNQKQRKDSAGSLLMKKMMKPRKRNADGSFVWWDAPENIERLMAYCEQDVRTEQETDALLPQLTASEYDIWKLDQEINDRGIYIDVEAVTRAVDIVEYAKREINRKLRAITNGQVEKTSQLAKLVHWIRARGIVCEQLRKGDQEDIMVMSDLSGDPVVREAIMLRREGAKTSTAKFSKMLGCVCADGRLRGQFSYHGAGPGRWAGRLVQLQNLVRVDPDTEADAVNFVVSILSTPYSCEDAHNMIEMAGYQVMTVLAKAMRAMVCAEPMRKFFGGDFSNIEGRVNAWLAGQEDKLDAFRAYDAGTGPDLYKVTAAGILGLTPDTVSKIQRQTTGKVPELACGYQGGVQAFVKMAYTQNPPVKAEDMVPPVKAATPPDVWASMLECFPTARDRGDLQPDVWTAVKLAVTGWRKKNDKIVAGWWELQDAAIEAVSYPNNPIKVYNERVTYLCIDGWLLCQLPSGRVISYANPWIKRTVEQRVKYDGRWIDIQDFPSPPGMLADALWLQENGFEVSERVKNTVWFMGIDSETKQWVPKSLYGGLQCENIVQGFAADLLREAMKNVTTLEYDIVLHAHDELLSEVDEAYGSLDEYKMLMSIAPDCAAGLPLAVAVWEDVRYVK